MATNFLELATTLKYLGAKWLPGKKVNFMPCIGWGGGGARLVMIIVLGSLRVGKQVTTEKISILVLEDSGLRKFLILSL